MSLSKLVHSNFGVHTLNRVSDVTSCATTITALLNENPNRVGFIISNVGANTIYIATDNSVSTSRGIPIFSGGSVSLNWHDDLESVSKARWGIASGTASDVYIEETIIIHSEGEKE